jgi:hypothetical protein
MINANVKALESFVHITVPEEGALLGSKLQFSMIIGLKVRPTSAPKNSKRREIRLDLI